MVPFQRQSLKLTFCKDAVVRCQIAHICNGINTVSSVRDLALECNVFGHTLIIPWPRLIRDRKFIFVKIIIGCEGAVFPVHHNRHIIYVPDFITAQTACLSKRCIFHRTEHCPERHSTLTFAYKPVLKHRLFYAGRQSG